MDVKTALLNYNLIEECKWNNEKGLFYLKRE